MPLAWLTVCPVAGVPVLLSIDRPRQWHALMQGARQDIADGRRPGTQLAMTPRGLPPPPAEDRFVMRPPNPVRDFKSINPKTALTAKVSGYFPYF